MPHLGVDLRIWCFEIVPLGYQLSPCTNRFHHFSDISVGEQQKSFSIHLIFCQKKKKKIIMILNQQLSIPLPHLRIPWKISMVLSWNPSSFIHWRNSSSLFSLNGLVLLVNAISKNGICSCWRSCIQLKSRSDNNAHAHLRFLGNVSAATYELRTYVRTYVQYI